MTAVWAELAGREDMTTGLADDLRAIVRGFERGAPRSQQRALGPSQIGMACTRCLARYVLGVPVTRPFDDPWARIIGTAVHAWLDEAAVAECVRIDEARWLAELRVNPDDELLPSGGRCDLYDTHRRMVIDHKIVGPTALTKYRANGPGAQYRSQAHLYGLGYANAGHAVDWVAIAYWPRGGRLNQLHVWAEPYDPSRARAVLDRFRLIRDLALSVGVAILPELPADASCWDCEGKDV